MTQEDNFNQQTLAAEFEEKLLDFDKIKFFNQIINTNKTLLFLIIKIILWMLQRLGVTVPYMGQQKCIVSS